MSYERQPASYEDESRERQEWWHVGPDSRPDAPLALQRTAEQQELVRLESELNQLDYADPTKRHERQALRERIAGVEIARAVRELLMGGLHDPETRASLREAYHRLQQSAAMFDRPDDAGELS